MRTVLYISILFGTFLCDVVSENSEYINIIDKIATYKYEADKVTIRNSNADFENEIYDSDNNNSKELLLNVKSKDNDSVIIIDDSLNSNKVLNSEEILTENDFEDAKENISHDNGHMILNHENEQPKRSTLSNKLEAKLSRHNIKPKLKKFSIMNEAKVLFPVKESITLDSLFYDIDEENEEVISKVRSSEEVTKEDSSREEVRSGGEVSNEDVSREEDFPNVDDLFSSESVSANPHINRLRTDFNKTVNRFICTTENPKESVIVYGARSWTFERQDVNLTLSYPMTQTQSDSEGKRYLVTGFHVILITDGLGSRGYINGGGVLRNNISLSFISPDISYLLYEFKVFGIPQYSVEELGSLNNLFYMCS